MDRVSIDVLELSVRANNSLACSNILFIDELEQVTASDLLKSRNFGLKSLREVRKELAKYGTCLKHDYIANTENEKKVIEELPILIAKIRDEVRELNGKVQDLYLILDKLYVGINPQK